MKNKIFLTFMLFFISLPLMAVETYTYRTFKAESSKDNPNILNITSSYESKDENGNIKKDSSSSSVDLTDNKSYSVRMNDNDAQFAILPEEDDVFINHNVKSNFDDLYRQHVEAINRMNRMFDDDPFFTRRKHMLSNNTVKQFNVKEKQAEPREKDVKRTSYFKNLSDWLKYLNSAH